jgi:predicted transcriptional regulator
MKTNLLRLKTAGDATGCLPAPGAAADLPVEAGASAEAGERETFSPTWQPAAEWAGGERAETGHAKIIRDDVTLLDEERKKLVDKLLTEGCRPQEVAQVLQKGEGDGVTLDAVAAYYRGNRELQAQRAAHMVKAAKELQASLVRSPESAEARLASALLLAGYGRIHGEDNEATSGDSEQLRTGRTTATVKNYPLDLRTEKVVQDIDCSRARARLVTVTEDKVQEEIRKLQREETEHVPGEPMGPKILEQIHGVYGLVLEPTHHEEEADEARKPVPEQPVQ